MLQFDLLENFLISNQWFSMKSDGAVFLLGRKISMKNAKNPEFFIEFEVYVRFHLLIGDWSSIPLKTDYERALSISINETQGWH